MGDSWLNGTREANRRQAGPVIFTCYEYQCCVYTIPLLFSRQCQDLHGVEIVSIWYCFCDCYASRHPSI